MKLSQLRSRCRPHLWYQLYWVVYLIWFFWLDLTVTAPKYILHSPLDDLIPFNEWFVLPYCSWFLLLAGVLLLALPAAWKRFVEVYFPLLRYIVDSAAEMPDLYSGYGVRLFASSLSLPAMFFILHLVVKKIFLRSFLHTAWEHVKNKT